MNFKRLLTKHTKKFEQCMLTEYNNGFFNDESNFREYQLNAEIILKPVETIFSDLFRLTYYYVKNIKF